MKTDKFWKRMRAGLNLDFSLLHLTEVRETNLPYYLCIYLTPQLQVVHENRSILKADDSWFELSFQSFLFPWLVALKTG